MWKYFNDPQWKICRFKNIRIHVDGASVVLADVEEIAEDFMSYLNKN